MNQFVNHLLSRHLESDKNLKPRVRGRFEPLSNAPGVFTGIDNEFSANDPARHPVTNNTAQPVSPQQSLHPDFSREQTTVPEQSKLLGNVKEETETQHHMYSPSFRSRFSPVEDKGTKKRNGTGNNAEGYLSSSIVRPVSGVLKENASDEKNMQMQVPEEHFSQSNNESQSASFLAEKGFAGRKASSIRSDSAAAETVKPVLKIYNTDGFESNKGGVLESLQQSPRLRHFDASSVQRPDETTHQPVIKVTIGRIDVRAVVQATPSPVKSTAAAKPKLSLEDYLKQRNNNTA